MILEIARLTATPGHEAALEAAVAEAAPLFARARGCLSMALRRSIEDREVYLLMVEWETLEDHMEHFRGSEDFQAWRAIVSPHFAAPPAVEHVAGPGTLWGPGA